jgi:hypothetical protein
MSQEMVNEVWNRNYFNISNVVRGRNTVVIWEFSQVKMDAEEYKRFLKKDEDGLLISIFSGILEFADNLDDDEAFREMLFKERPTKPSILIFTNNKLTDIYY